MLPSYFNICYIDEAGCSASLPAKKTNIQPLLVVAGLIVQQDTLAGITREFLALKRKYFPGSFTSAHPLDDVREEIKDSGEEIRRSKALICEAPFVKKHTGQELSYDSSTKRSICPNAMSAGFLRASGSKGLAFPLNHAKRIRGRFSTPVVRSRHFWKARIPAASWSPISGQRSLTIRSPIRFSRKSIVRRVIRSGASLSCRPSG